MQQGEVQWDMTTVFTEPKLALKMFAIVAMVSLSVAALARPQLLDRSCTPATAKSAQ